MNTHYPPAVLSHLCIWQQNTQKSHIAHHHILNTNPSLFNIILIQEPWLDSYSKARGNHHWCILYPTNCYDDNHNMIRSIMLINTNISTDLYTQLNIQHSDITTIHLKGNFGFCSIFNIYNNCNNNSTTNSLHAFLNVNPASALSSPTDHMLWLGDFNRHHPLWEEDKNCRLFNPLALIDPLIDLISKYDMILTLPLGIPTYETANRNWTRPDSIW